ncbi:MAG: hypothetical protein IT347_10730 [Candidatus Eisenbacteria bacterium]|nr:hypothetical protein [Candidatus Eisenbacteria bacterium]
MLRFLRFRVLLAVALILFAMAAVHQAMHTTQGVKGALEDGPLASADFRAPIVDVETLLFSPAPLSMEDRTRLAGAIDAMRRELEARGGTNLAKYSARELGTLAGMSRGLGRLEGDPLDRVRQNWMRIRSNTFDDAWWYRFSESDPPVPREEPPTK